LTRLICPIGAQIGAWLGAMPAQECLIGRLLDERAVGGVTEPCSVGPYRFDTGALQQREPVRALLPTLLQRTMSRFHPGCDGFVTA